MEEERGKEKKHNSAYNIMLGKGFPQFIYFYE